MFYVGGALWVLEDAPSVDCRKKPHHISFLLALSAFRFGCISQVLFAIHLGSLLIVYNLLHHGLESHIH